MIMLDTNVVVAFLNGDKSILPFFVPSLPAEKITSYLIMI